MRQNGLYSHGEWNKRSDNTHVSQIGHVIGHAKVPAFNALAEILEACRGVRMQDSFPLTEPEKTWQD